MRRQSINCRLTLDRWSIDGRWTNGQWAINRQSIDHQLLAAKVHLVQQCDGVALFFYYPLSVDRLHVITSLPLCWRMITKDSSLAFSSTNMAAMSFSSTNMAAMSLVPPTWLPCLCHEPLGIYSNGSTGPQRGEEGRWE